MKKIIMLCLMVAIIASMSVSVFATTGGFVSSPSNNQAPKLLSVKTDGKNVTPEFDMTAYADRDELSEEARKEIEEAYASIKENVDLSSLNAALAKVAKKLDVEVSELAVSDLFDLAPKDEATFEDGEKHTVAIKAETLKNFVSLLHYEDGEWVIVEDAEVSDDGKNLTFTVDGFSPFATVVSTGDAPNYGEDITAGAVVGIAAAAVGVGGLGVATKVAISNFELIKPKRT